MQAYITYLCEAKEIVLLFNQALSHEETGYRGARILNSGTR
jgi:hypothetical protein